MPSDRAWTIKGVSGRTREAVLEAAHAAGLNVGEWVDRVLARAAEEARHPRPPAASREDVAEVVKRVVAEGLRPVMERLEQLERRTASPGTTRGSARQRRPLLTLPGPGRGGGSER